MLKVNRLLIVGVLFFCAVTTFAQEKKDTVDNSAQATIQINTNTRIPKNSTVYINAMDGFETYIIAALQKKKVPLVIVADREKADFEIKGSVEKQRAGIAKTIFGSGMPSIDATMQVVNINTGVVVFSNSSTKNNAYRGKKGSAEHLAKNLAKKMRDDGDMIKE